MLRNFLKLFSAPYPTQYFLTNGSDKLYPAFFNQSSQFIYKPPLCPLLAKGFRPDIRIHYDFHFRALCAL